MDVIRQIRLLEKVVNHKRGDEKVYWAVFSSVGEEEGKWLLHGERCNNINSTN